MRPFLPEMHPTPTNRTSGDTHIHTEAPSCIITAYFRAKSSLLCHPGAPSHTERRVQQTPFNDTKDIPRRSRGSPPGPGDSNFRSGRYDTVQSLRMLPTGRQPCVRVFTAKTPCSLNDHDEREAAKETPPVPVAVGRFAMNPRRSSVDR